MQGTGLGKVEVHGQFSTRTKMKPTMYVCMYVCLTGDPQTQRVRGERSNSQGEWERHARCSIIALVLYFGRILQWARGVDGHCMRQMSSQQMRVS